MENTELYIDQIDDKDLQNRFTAYVREAMKNTRSTYYIKKLIREGRELCFSKFDESMLIDSGDILETLLSHSFDMIETISLWNALQKLSGQDITIIKLRVLYENSYREIGKTLKITESTARMRYCRAIKRLRKAMER